MSQLSPIGQGIAGRSMPLGDFSAQAGFYHRARPSYPASLVERLVEDAQLKPGDPAAEFGAGTGIFTRLLVERGLKVSAIEPNVQMQQQHDVPEADWGTGTFESSGLETASQRWAVAAQAFHWAEPSRTLPEIRRILQEDCLLTVLWNNRATDQSEILRWTENLIRQHVPEFEEAYRDHPWPQVLESTGDFTFMNQYMVEHEITMSRERYLALWRSHNRLNVIAGEQRAGEILLEINRHLEQRQISEVRVPYRCEAWSARRNSLRL